MYLLRRVWVKISIMFYFLWPCLQRFCLLKITINRADSLPLGNMFLVLIYIPNPVLFLSQHFSNFVYSVSSALDPSSISGYPTAPLFSFRSQLRLQVSQEVFPESRVWFSILPLHFSFNAQCLAVASPLSVSPVRLYTTWGSAGSSPLCVSSGAL